MVHTLLAGGGKSAARAIADGLVATHRPFRFETPAVDTSAYVVDTMRTVLHMFFAKETFADAVVATVNQGGDADTAGALVGMLAGTAYGTAAIPNHWLRRVDAKVVADIRAQVPALLAIGARLRET
jgi:ADP-ribosyl-[dinitrogen reductase] hydrolase